MIDQIFAGYLDWAALPLRLAVGILFVVHGYPKLIAPGGLKGTIGWLKSQGVPGAVVIAPLVALLEFLGGLALIVGLLTPIVSILFTIEMVFTTIFSKVKLGKKFAMGYELDVVLLAGSITLAILGGGAPSLDRLLRL